MFRISFLAVLTATAGLAGCQKPSTLAPGTSSGPTAMPTTNATSPLPDPHAASEFNPVRAQPRLQTMKLYIGAEVVTTELALTRDEVQTGMMFRKSMPEDEAMLFVFAVPHRVSFYMRNTTVPLTAAYMDSEGTILELHDLQPLNETPVPAGVDNIQFVLEMNQGWFKRHNINPGVVISCETGRLRDAFHTRSTP